MGDARARGLLKVSRFRGGVAIIPRDESDPSRESLAQLCNVAARLLRLTTLGIRVQHGMVTAYGPSAERIARELTRAEEVARARG